MRMATTRHYTRRGTRTSGHARVVKAPKGIGKSASLVAAESMRAETWAHGKKTTLPGGMVTLLEST